MTKILHQKLPTKNGYMVFSVQTTQMLHEYLCNQVKNLNEDYVVITTPTNIECLNDDEVVLQIDAKKYTYAELRKILKGDK